MISMKDYNSIYEKYAVNFLTITPELLVANGFKLKGDKAYFSKYVYKDIDKLNITIQLSNNSYEMNVIDTDHDQIYYPFYFWDSGKNLELEEVSDNVSKVFKAFYKKGIFYDTQIQARKKY